MHAVIYRLPIRHGMVVTTYRPATDHKFSGFNTDSAG